jgi:hypothetical protein
MSVVCGKSNKDTNIYSNTLHLCCLYKTLVGYESFSGDMNSLTKCTECVFKYILGVTLNCSSGQLVNASIRTTNAIFFLSRVLLKNTRKIMRASSLTAAVSYLRC